MQQILSKNEKKEPIVQKVTNKTKVIKALVNYGKMSQWDIKGKTGLLYPRVDDAIAILERDGYVQKNGERLAQNGLPSTLYSLTFKGVLKYIAIMELEKCPSNTPGEDYLKKIDEFKKSPAFHKRNKQLDELQTFLSNIGKEFNYPFFSEIAWLVDNYGKIVLSPFMVGSAEKTLLQKWPEKGVLEHEKGAKQELTKYKKNLEKNPAFQEKVRIAKTKNPKVLDLAECMSLLKHHSENVNNLLKGEYSWLQKTFAESFFESIHFFAKASKKKAKSINKPLTDYAEALLKEKKQTLASLEETAQMFRGI